MMGPLSVVRQPRQYCSIPQTDSSRHTCYLGRSSIDHRQPAGSDSGRVEAAGGWSTCHCKMLQWRRHRRPTVEIARDLDLAGPVEAGGEDHFVADLLDAVDFVNFLLRGF